MAAAAVVAEDEVSGAIGVNGNSEQRDAVWSNSSEEKSSLFDLISETSSEASSSIPPALPATATKTFIGRPLGTPEEFLQASFPNTPLIRIQDLLASGVLDLEAIVEELLNEEYVRELDERGVNAESSSTDADSGVWFLVEKQRSRNKDKNQAKSSTTIPPKKAVSKGGGKRGKKLKGQTIALVDVRQSQHRPRPASSLGNGGVRAAPDLWSQITSLSEYLSDLFTPISTVQSSFFLPFFHSPQYATPAAAIRAALEDIIRKRNKGKVNQARDEDAVTMALFPLLDIVCAHPSFENLDSVVRTRLCDDAQLALRATGGVSDVALDIVLLLREMDVDATRNMQMGAYHSSASFSPPTSPRPTSPIPNFLSPSLSNGIAQSETWETKLSFINGKNSENAWQTVKPRPLKPPLVHPLASHIPAYSSENSRKLARVKRGTGNTSGKGGKGDVGELSNGSSGGGWSNITARQISAYGKQRDDALRDASRYWQRGNAKTRGGEVALYFAERVSPFVRYTSDFEFVAEFFGENLGQNSTRTITETET